MIRNLIGVTLGIALFAAAAAAQTQPAQPQAAESLGTITITQPVLAGGVRLEPGTYEVRLTAETLAPLPGQTPGAERRVEFVANGAVVARDAAVVHEPEAAGTSGGAGSPRVQLLKGGEFVRVSATRDGRRYLIHLPVAP
ncbi:MAG: hypothetical protein AB7P99_20955 [Vicinamibacterales bacterium]